MHPPWHLDEPLWRSHRIFGENLFFIRETPGALPAARLLFPPAGDIDLTSASHEIAYASPADYLVDAATGIVTLPPGSRIPFTDRAALYPKIGSEHCMAHKRGDETTGLLFSEGHFFHDRQAVASYAHSSQWQGFIPQCQMDRLPGLAEILRGAAPLTVGVIGDSISTGCNASAYLGVAPWMPPFVDLWAGEIRRRRAGEVVVKNFAISGTGMKYGMAVVEKVIAEAPHLVLIAYGMNDVGFITEEAFVGHTTRLIGAIQAGIPAAEIILAASMLGNPEWQYTPLDKALRFRDALAALAGPGIALADLTSLWAGLLKVKSYQDLTGNGVNHPNDFGHRLYAQVLLELLGIGGATELT